MSIADRILRVKSSLPGQVELVAVSKTYPAQRIMEAYEAGQRIFGENRPQEMAQKYEELPKDIEWHLIGHLQTNKVKMVVPFVAMIHSLDSVRLAEAIQKAAAAAGRTIDVLLEIHVADEESKSGWEWAELQEYVRSGAFARLPNLRVRGVMGVATNTGDEQVIRRGVSSEGAANVLEGCVELVRFAEDDVAGEQLARLGQHMWDAGDGLASTGKHMTRVVCHHDSQAAIVLGHHDVLVRRQIVQRGVLLLEGGALLAQCLGCEVVIVGGHSVTLGIGRRGSPAG